MLPSVFINFQWCLKQKCWRTSHTLLVQVTQKPTHGNKYTTKIFNRPKWRWSHWPAFRIFMDRKRRFECSFGFFGVKCSIFKWICLNDFSAYETFFHSTSNVKQLVNPQNLTCGFIFRFSSFEISLKTSIKAYKTTKTITNQVWECFWLPESITNANPDE